MKKPEKPGKNGRPKFKIDKEILKQLAAIQCTQTEIAAVLGCSVKTLERRLKIKAYQEVFQTGKEKGKMSLRRKQYETAMSGNVTMQIWLGKQYLGQMDKQETLQHDKVDWNNVGKQFVDAVKTIKMQPNPNFPEEEKNVKKSNS